MLILLQHRRQRIVRRSQYSVQAPIDLRGSTSKSKFRHKLSTEMKQETYQHVDPGTSPETQTGHVTHMRKLTERIDDTLNFTHPRLTYDNTRASSTMSEVQEPTIRIGRLHGQRHQEVVVKFGGSRAEREGRATTGARDA